MNFVTLLKSATGRPRPNFIDVCKLKNFKTGEYMDETKYECKDKTDEAYKSFPSGHTSTAFFYVVFLIVKFFL